LIYFLVIFLFVRLCAQIIAAGTVSDKREANSYHRWVAERI